ncbi:MAG: hypothetical protein IT428_31245 [Planctomycetaceae bacterium]|nr:hypothetical protein [Planctomycetaceae bacterium]
MRKHGTEIVAVALLFASAVAATQFVKKSAAQESKPAPTVDSRDSKAQERRKQELSKFMREKLEASSDVLEGLATEDFKLIASGAKRMQRLSAAEKWQVSNDASYRQFSNQFRRIMEQLETKANEKKLEGAALTWIEGTMTCIECHKWVRNTIIAEK